MVGIKVINFYLFDKFIESLLLLYLYKWKKNCYFIKNKDFDILVLGKNLY